MYRSVTIDLLDQHDTSYHASLYNAYIGLHVDMFGEGVCNEPTLNILSFAIKNIFLTSHRGSTPITGRPISWPYI